MKLYNYWRSSSSWRVRLALAHKGVAYEYVAVNLLKGEQHQPAHKERNPTGMVPVLELDSGERIAQSMAIAEYLEEAYPERPLLPKALAARGHVRMLCELVNSGIQPFQNPGTTNHVRDVLHADEKAFARHFIALGLENLQKLATAKAGRYLCGDAVTLADCFLVPQLYAARRFGVETAGYALLHRIEAACAALPAFAAAHADRQPDAQP